MDEITTQGDRGLQRTAAEVALEERSHEVALDEQSIGQLVSRLARESRELATIEVDRLRAEMQVQTRRVAKVAAFGGMAADFLALASLALGVGIFLLLAAWWNSSVGVALAALVTCGLFLLGAGIAALVMRSTAKRR